MRILTTVAIGALIATSATAQQILHESITDRAKWTHQGGTWNDGVANNLSKFGKVDRLVSAKSFTYTRVPVVLDAGTYVAVARLAKESNITGSAPIILKTIIPSSTPITMPVSEQKVDEFRHTRALTFTLPLQTTVIFAIENADQTITKQNYLFDDFYIGEVPGGPVALVESLDRRWGHSHGAPHYTTEVPDASAIFGHVEEMGARSGAGLWWFDWRSQVHTFTPGIHTYNFRIKKTVSGAGWADFDLYYQVSKDGGATWTRSAINVWTRETQTVDRWVLSPNISFKVDKATDQYRFFFYKIGGAGNGAKFDYKFDAFIVRKGEFTSFGSSCMKNGESFLDSTNIPQLGHQFDIRLRPLNTPAILILGLSNPDLSLFSFGWPGCSLYASTDIFVPMPWARGFPRLSIPIPRSNSLLNVPFYMQAYKVTRTNGIVTSNGARGQIEN